MRKPRAVPDEVFENIAISWKNIMQKSHSSTISICYLSFNNVIGTAASAVEAKGK
jgi:hypothetical protein